MLAVTLLTLILYTIKEQFKFIVYCIPIMSFCAIFMLSIDPTSVGGGMPKLKYWGNVGKYVSLATNDGGINRIPHLYKSTLVRMIPTHTEGNTKLKITCSTTVSKALSWWILGQGHMITLVGQLLFIVRYFEYLILINSHSHPKSLYQCHVGMFQLCQTDSKGPARTEQHIQNQCPVGDNLRACEFIKNQSS